MISGIRSSFHASSCTSQNRCCCCRLIFQEKEKKITRKAALAVTGTAAAVAAAAAASNHSNKAWHTGFVPTRIRVDACVKSFVALEQSDTKDERLQIRPTPACITQRAALEAATTTTRPETTLPHLEVVVLAVVARVHPGPPVLPHEVLLRLSSRLRPRRGPLSAFHVHSTSRGGGPLGEDGRWDGRRPVPAVAGLGHGHREAGNQPPNLQGRKGAREWRGGGRILDVGSTLLRVCGDVSPPGVGRAACA